MGSDQQKSSETKGDGGAILGAEKKNAERGRGVDAGRVAIDALRERFEFPHLLPGWVWLVGAGPGSLSLMTLLGASALGQADVVLYDSLIDQTLLGLAGDKARRVEVGKRAGRDSTPQNLICDQLVAFARQGQRVVRLKGGDPFVFGRGGEEAARLVEAQIPFRVVPGLTSGLAALTYAGIPATHRDANQSLTFLSAHDRSGGFNQEIDWAEQARLSEVLVIFMGTRLLVPIVEALVQGGRPVDDPVAIISRATWPDQRVLEGRLDDILTLAQQRPPRSPALIVVGPTVRWRSSLDWFTAFAHEGSNGP